MGMNVCIFSGNLGSDCESRVTQSGKTIANFSLPVKQGYGEHEKTSWVRCVLLGKMAESLPQYLTKGAKVTVSGEFLMNEWNDQQGQKRSTAELIVRDLDLPPKSQGNQANNQQYQQAPQQSYQQPAQQPMQQAPAPQPQQAYQQPRQQQPAPANRQNPSDALPPSSQYNQQHPHNQQQPPGQDQWDDDLPFQGLATNMPGLCRVLKACYVATNFKEYKLKQFMSVGKGLPKDDDRALYLDIKVAEENELEQFSEDGGFANATFFVGKFHGQAYDENGFVCLGLPLKTVTHWRYSI